MPSSRATAESRKSTLIALIIFIALFLAVSAFSVWMYMGRADLERQAADATQSLNKLATSSERKMLESMSAGSGKTAIGQITQDMRAMGQLIGGSDMGDLDPVGILEEVSLRLKPLWAPLVLALNTNLQIDLSNPDVLAEEATKMQAVGLAVSIQSLITEMQMWSDRYIQEASKLEQQQILHEDQLKTKDAEIAQLHSDLDKATNAAQTNKAGYDELLQKQVNDYERVINELKQQYTESEQLQKEYHTKNTALESELANASTQISELKKLLQQYRPSPDTGAAALEPDGFVVSVAPQEKLAYINLAKNDHIYRGLTFSVYDSYVQIPKSGQGKGTLEVIEIMDTISKCRITNFDPTNPIMEHDIIANLVWSETKKYNFCVAGEFDFNKDGKRTPEDRASIVKLIESWGGQVSSTLSVSTDFLVLGEPPVIPPRPADEFDVSQAAAVQAYRQAVEQRDAYDQIRANSAALGVPTFNLSRFLYFIGYY